MDSYRGHLGHPTLDNWHAPGDEVELGADSADEDDIARQPPPVSVGQDERRMQVRAYNYWASLLNDRPFPQMADLISAKAPDFADHAVMLDFSQTIADPAVAMLGEKLAEECGAATSIRRLGDVPGGSVLSRITDHCLQILANEAPIGFEAEFVNQRGKTLLYRGILLPFSSDGNNVRHIMGVINWKELADPLVIAELRHELEIAGGATQTQLPGRLGAWADGPTVIESGEPDVAQPLTSGFTDRELGEWLAAARRSAEAALCLEARTLTALNAASGLAWDFALAAAADPVGLRDMIAETRPTRPERAPMMSVVELVFGAALNRTRATEFATVLAHAQRLGVERGALAGFLAGVPGGLKQVVREERKLRRSERVSRIG